MLGRTVFQKVFGQILESLLSHGGAQIDQGDVVMGVDVQCLLRSALIMIVRGGEDRRNGAFDSFVSIFIDAGFGAGFWRGRGGGGEFLHGHALQQGDVRGVAVGVVGDLGAAGRRRVIV